MRSSAWAWRGCTFSKPAYAVLDEATSAINPDEEGAFYSHLGTLGITAFSIAHRLELKRFHHQHLHFHADGTGGWTLERIKGGKRYARRMKDHRW